MANNPNKKVSPKDEPMNGAMKFFLAGCIAELYLLILRRFYKNHGVVVPLRGFGEKRKS